MAAAQKTREPQTTSATAANAANESIEKTIGFSTARPLERSNQSFPWPRLRGLAAMSLTDRAPTFSAAVNAPTTTKSATAANTDRRDGLAQLKIVNHSTVFVRRV